MSDVETIAIACRGLRKQYGPVVAVDGLDLTVRRGECFGLLGPNGAGKTTTIEILEGLTRPDAGSVEILAKNWNGNGNELRQRIGISLQETRLNDKLTVYETLRLFRSFYRDGKEPDALLDTLALLDKRDARIARLSGGQRQRLAVACALIGNPEILFLDEPTTGLDPQSRLQLWEEIRQFRGNGGSILLTTHYMDEAERLCDRIAIVDHGRLIALGSPAELIASLRAANIIEFQSDPMLPEATLRMLPEVHDVLTRGPNWALTVESLVTAVPRLLLACEEEGSRLVHLSTHRATLEDVFVALTGRELRDA
ncbi:MAG TPA: ABC transporter ATP-binding protein [Thermoanaerobaculia bacterium]|nr:ABC transporter ATP-binding protein [Thermoanaerobaculia bacterium]